MCMHTQRITENWAKYILQDYNQFIIHFVCLLFSFMTSTLACLMEISRHAFATLPRFCTVYICNNVSYSGLTSIYNIMYIHILAII